ncbi:MAG: Hdr-like menaquinol oxidoreductase cytochrome c subunit [Burkholderiales bacterium]|nr:Hdr-like menaquinol oxidoreductase cytochrome c subunit [Burkholderiales bacterium]
MARAICLLALLLPVLAFASDRVPKPVIDIDKAGKCVEDTATMRREHPDMLKHQRDSTMHEGIRTTKYSLKACVACHASKTSGSVLGEKGFCQSCHAYASVTIDCFRCHSSKPKRTSGVTP